ncbi:DUF4198 domain-containing protein [Chachezhania sediminis]|uniref:DUF4198 domain-containing protein n=1 Tax=Chachezhania sediminis TaxID=2599291 RepID=UPI00131BADA7|nr:DUF4198 domain-containing protein [Chachezhania sediminis]
MQRETCGPGLLRDDRQQGWRKQGWRQRLAAGLGLTFGLGLAAAPQQGQAHFLLNYTSDAVIDRPGDVPVGMIFWHPFANGPVMELDPPEAFYVIHRGERTDLAGTLAPMSFRGAENEAGGFLGQVPVKRAGDYVLVTEQSPYLEVTEDIYIQQFVKTVLNRATLPTDWDTVVGLPAEIVPLNRPYNVLAGSTFSGIVLSEGKPVPDAEIEIEFVAAEPDLETATAGAPLVAPPPGGTLVAKTGPDGVFTFGIPKAGWWGFAALGVGPVTEHEGKELSQDAVIWIRAHALDG